MVSSDVLAFTRADPHMAELFERMQQLSDLINLCELVGWDQRVNMPRWANQIRGPQLATLKVLIHKQQCAPRLGKLLDTLQARVQGTGYTAVDRGLVREARRRYDQAMKIPSALTQEVAEASAAAWGAWEQAKPASDFTLFAPHLRKLVMLKREEAECLGYDGSPYDALLDQFEPGMTLEILTPILERVRETTVDLLRRIQNADQAIDTACLHGHFDPNKQRDLCKAVLRQIGYRFEAGRLDSASHPFTAEAGSPFDVRVTTRFDTAYLPTALMAALHEGGHALYEQGIDPVLARTILAGGASLGLHEAQARLWENSLGRSLPFWRHSFGLVREAFPETFAQCGVEEFVRALNAVKPGLIRVEADEVTYNLHIIIRFEIEQGLINGTLDVTDVPDLWNQNYQTYLGITSPTSTTGVLQDIQWALGKFGYFPTYTLGNLYGAQIYQTLRRVFPEYDERLAAEGTGFLLTWLCEQMYICGKVYTPGELVRSLTGEDLNPEHFVQYAQDKFGRFYDLRAE